MNATERQHQLRELVEEIDDRGEDLTDWEIGFIANIIDKDLRTFTKAQANAIRRIHRERVD